VRLAVILSSSPSDVPESSEAGSWRRQLLLAILSGIGDPDVVGAAVKADTMVDVEAAAVVDGL
jgi:hypothetical protein